MIAAALRLFHAASLAREGRERKRNHGGTRRNTVRGRAADFVPPASGTVA